MSDDLARQEAEFEGSLTAMLTELTASVLNTVPIPLDNKARDVILQALVLRLAPAIEENIEAITEEAREKAQLFCFAAIGAMGGRVDIPERLLVDPPSYMRTWEEPARNMTVVTVSHEPMLEGVAYYSDKPLPTLTQVVEVIAKLNEMGEQTMPYYWAEATSIPGETPPAFARRAGLSTLEFDALAWALEAHERGSIH